MNAQTRVERHPPALPGAAIRRVAAGPVADGMGCADATGPQTPAEPPSPLGSADQTPIPCGVTASPKEARSA